MITGIIIVSSLKEENIELKVPRVLKRTIRCELLRSITSGNYASKAHILGEIAYVNYIEKENKNPYLFRIKKYIQSTGEKIKYFPELVTAYNENLLFTDLKMLDYYDIPKVDDSIEYKLVKKVYKERRIYLHEHGIEDICRYANLPKEILDSFW